MKRTETIPAPDAEATHAKVQLLGGPWCGDELKIPLNAAEFKMEDGTCYHYCPHATERLGRETFLHSHLDPFLCAR